ARFSNLLFSATATAVIYTLSLHDALPIWGRQERRRGRERGHRGRARGARDQGLGPCRQGVQRRLERDAGPDRRPQERHPDRALRDRKSTRLNSSHSQISYAVFCLKKKIID